VPSELEKTLRESFKTKNEWNKLGKYHKRSQLGEEDQRSIKAAVDAPKAKAQAGKVNVDNQAPFWEVYL
jgi:hypothetical protein